ncbi:Choline-sulfatase [Polystyrenella longa]|uniref:Choline-sulfatase n=1 Tax=Polystyrenella longa TaxID=2528007 RepID=A0A518CNG3_9PLAN|nr:sulfatase [Polystyrenella longa]QDU80771.1 Choline-sulfatase [Polystyrenella longa]
MTSHSFKTVVLTLLCLIAKAQAEPPNIVMLFLDDWGWNGSPVRMDESAPNSSMPVLEMPNVEKLANEGMVFRNAYAGAPQCSPSRVCLQTGQSSARNGFTVYMNASKDEVYDLSSQYAEFPVVPCASDQTIDPETITIPEALEPFGYASAHIGKWHMRGSPADEGYTVHDGDTDNKDGNTIQAKHIHPENINDPKLMFSITRRAIKFMENQVEAKTPFYLQISHYAMHEGRECLPETRKKYANHPVVQNFYSEFKKKRRKVPYKHDPAVWLGMGEDLDGRIGAVLHRIKELGIEDNTYVILVSDNGYRHSFYPGLNQPLHGHKWWLWQGGIRVPMIVKGPGIKGGTSFAGNVVGYDFLPTFVDWAGGDPTSLKEIDGVSLKSYMSGEEPGNDFLNRPLYFHYPHYRTTMPHSAIVAGNRKILHFYEQPNITMMFDLSVDEGEVKNIAADYPAEHKSLHTAMMQYFTKVGARIPKVNLKFDEAIYKEAKEYQKRMIWGPFEGTRLLDADERIEN